MPIFPQKNFRWLLSRQFNLNFFPACQKWSYILTCMNVCTIITGAQFLVNFELPTVRKEKHLSGKKLEYMVPLLFEL